MVDTRRVWLRSFFTLLLSIVTCVTVAVTPTPQPSALLLTVTQAIGPATQDYIIRGLSQAQQQHSNIVIIQLDTPGGLDKAMRAIVAAILASPLPVATYVAPSGARAASAGTFILYASHIAAMAPGTHVGAATPVNISPTSKTERPQASSAEERKITSDALAYIRSLAQLRGRNSDWAQQAVSRAASLSAPEALQAKVIDVIAIDVPDLLRKIDGKTISLRDQTYTLHTAGLAITTLAPDWRTRFLAVITDPNIAYILFLLGIYALLFEFWNPGMVLPGIVGAIALLLALYAFQLLPVNYVGLSLIVLAISLFIAELFFPSGVLAIGGVVGFILGSLLLLPSNVPGFTISVAVILALGILTAAFFLLVINLAVRARLRPVVSGGEELINSVGIVSTIQGQYILVRLHGELWQARCATPLSVGQSVVVTARHGLIVSVQPLLPGSQS